MKARNGLIRIFLLILVQGFFDQIRFLSAEDTDSGTCESRPLPSVRVGGEIKLVNEDNFVSHQDSYPPEGTVNENSLNYFILNQGKSVLYVSDFLNRTTSNELKDFCVSGDRFIRSPIRGYGNKPGVTESSARTR